MIEIKVAGKTLQLCEGEIKKPQSRFEADLFAKFIKRSLNWTDTRVSVQGQGGKQFGSIKTPYISPSSVNSDGWFEAMLYIDWRWTAEAAPDVWVLDSEPPLAIPIEFAVIEKGNGDCEIIWVIRDSVFAKAVVGNDLLQYGSHLHGPSIEAPREYLEKLELTANA